MSPSVQQADTLPLYHHRIGDDDETALLSPAAAAVHLLQASSKSSVGQHGCLVVAPADFIIILSSFKCSGIAHWTSMACALFVMCEAANDWSSA